MLLGVDVGTTNLKAALVDRDGLVCRTASRPTPFAPAGGGAQMDVEALEEALFECISALGPGRSEVAAVGLAGMAESGAPFARGRPLGPILAWYDGRGEETAARLVAALGSGLARRTGRRVRSVSSLAKLGWQLDHGVPAPERWLGVPETCLFLLAGAEATEHSLAARTGAYDVTGGDWIPDATAVLGLTPAVFPPVRPAGAPMGEVTAPAAARFGLSAGVPVTVAGHDHLAAAEGVGAAGDDQCNSVGTAETLLRHTDTLPDVARALALGLAVSVRPGGRGWVVLASAARPGPVLDPLADSVGATPAELDRRAEEAPGDPPGAQWMAALRGLVERTGEAATRLGELTGCPARMVVFGGGSRSRPWLALKARALHPVPVVRVTVPDAAVRGAALAAGVAARWWPALAAAPPAATEPVPPCG